MPTRRLHVSHSLSYSLSHCDEIYQEIIYVYIIYRWCISFLFLIRSLVNHFAKLILDVSTLYEGLFVMAIDGLDSFNTDNQAHTLKWLPTPPTKVKRFITNRNNNTKHRQHNSPSPTNHHPPTHKQQSTK